VSEKDPLFVGDILQDNDPRMTTNRTLEVIEVLPNGVAAKNRSGKVRLYLRHRIFTDQKPRKSGLTRVSSPHQMASLEPQKRSEE